MSNLSQFFTGRSYIGGIPGVNALPTYTAGRYYFPTCAYTSFATSAIWSANVMYFMPYFCAKANSFAGMAWYYSNGATDAGDKIRLGVYSTTNGTPGSLLVDCGEITIPSVNGIVEALATVTLAANTQYWLAGVANSTITGRNFTPSANILPVFEFGYESARFGAAVAAAPGVLPSATFTYAALPATAPTIDGVSTPAPLLALKA